MASFSVATNESYKDREGKKVESVEYHNCVAFGKSAELIGQYMKKGSHILITGKLQTRSWDDKETGKKLYRTEINVRDFQFGRKGASAGSTTAPQQEDQPAPSGDGIDFPADDVNPDDIPF